MEHNGEVPFLDPPRLSKQFAALIDISTLDRGIKRELIDRVYYYTINSFLKELL